MIAVRQLNSANFAPYGHVACAGQGITKSIRADTVLLTKSPSVFQHDAEALDLALDFYDVQPEGDVVRINQAERHEHSSQMFVPMSVTRYLVIVWEGHPHESAAHGFIGGPKDVVIYNPGVWHHGIIALDGPGHFASTMWRTRGGTDVEFLPLEAMLETRLEEAVS